VNKLFVVKLIQASGTQWVNSIDYFHSGFKVNLLWPTALLLYLLAMNIRVIKFY